MEQNWFLPSIEYLLQPEKKRIRAPQYNSGCTPTLPTKHRYINYFKYAGCLLSLKVLKQTSRVEKTRPPKNTAQPCFLKVGPADDCTGPRAAPGGRGSAAPTTSAGGVRPGGVSVGSSPAPGAGQYADQLPSFSPAAPSRSPAARAAPSAGWRGASATLPAIPSPGPPPPLPAVPSTGTRAPAPAWPEARPLGPAPGCPPGSVSRYARGNAGGRNAKQESERTRNQPPRTGPALVPAGTLKCARVVMKLRAGDARAGRGGNNEDRYALDPPSEKPGFQRVVL